MRNFLSGLAALLGLVAVSALSTTLSAERASATTVQFVTQHSGVDFSQTRANGYHKFRDDGLLVWTDTNEVSCAPTPCKNKVAGYLDVAPEALATVAAGAEPTLNYAAQFGSLPGYQLVVEGVDEDGLDRAWILVGEPGAYGNKWWAASCGDYCAKLKMPASGGGGSSYHGTLDEWASAQPNGVITRIGFSLGSGAYGRGVVRSLTLLDRTYVFKLHKKPVTATPTATTTTTVLPSLPPTSGANEPPATTTSTTTTSATSSSATSTTPITMTPRFANCAAVRAAGQAPILVGTPGFHPDLDANGNGIGCERADAINAASHDDGDLASTGTGGLATLVLVGTLLLVGGATATTVAVRRRRFGGSA